LSLKTHSPEPVPFALYDSRQIQNAKPRRFNEAAAENTGLLIEKAHLLLNRLVQR
jgi:2,3-bisphosphoglycerate-independent phosphoglycerate mutase